jgi:hypothetical protein
MTGAATLARFLPISAPVAAGGPVLFRRHPWSGVVGLFALASLAGAPGTPGGYLWLSVARDLIATRQTWLVLALASAWVCAFSVVVQQSRHAFGVRSLEPIPEQPVPWQARAAMWAAGAMLAAYGYTAVLR